jgi:hypothetical protein
MTIPPEISTRVGDALADMLRKSGIVMLFLVGVGWALSAVYQDLDKRNDAFVDLLRANVTESRGVAEVLKVVADRLERLERANGHPVETSPQILPQK